MSEEDLKNRILNEMRVDYGDALERNFDLAKQFIGITKNGKIDVKFKTKLPNDDNIMLYLIGKLYANAAGLSETQEVTNRELMDELGMPLGSVVTSLKRLRDSHRIIQIKDGLHKVRVNEIEKALDSIKNKLKP